MFARCYDEARRGVSRAMLALAIICLALPAVLFAQVPSSSHVVLVIDENHSYTDVRNDMTWLVGQGGVIARWPARQAATSTYSSATHTSTMSRFIP